MVWFPESDPKAFFHELLVQALNRYYPNLQATLEYCCTEHRHLLRRSHWDTELIIKTLDATKGIHRVESKHLSLELAGLLQRIVWPRQLTKHWSFIVADALRRPSMTYHYPRFMLEEKFWTLDAIVSKLKAQVLLTSELTFKVIRLEDELCCERELLEQERREADDLRAELGHPKLHERIHLEPILKDAAPEE